MSILMRHDKMARTNTIQKHVEHHDAKDIKKKTLFCVFGFFFSSSFLSSPTRAVFDLRYVGYHTLHFLHGLAVYVY